MPTVAERTRCERTDGPRATELVEARGTELAEDTLSMLRSVFATQEHDKARIVHGQGRGKGSADGRISLRCMR